MATSYQSDRSSIAPTDFAVCTSFEEESGVISVAIENCQLCSSTRRPFHCPSCIQAGDFYLSHEPNKEQIVHRPASDQKYSVYTNRPRERYRDKLLRLQSLKKEKNKLLQRFQQMVTERTVVQQKQVEANLVKQRVDLLSKAVEEASQKERKEKDQWKSLRKNSDSTSTRCQRLADKKRRIVEYLEKLRIGIDNRRGELAICEDQLCQIRKQHIRQLVEHIFPITQVQPRSDSDSVGQSYVSELAEARHTAYIKGRWVYTDNGSEHKYRIVHPTLPGNGDYSSYLNWLLDNKSASAGPDPLTGDDHPAFTIGAALTYTTQLVSLIAYFLDINLPERMCYSNFCRNSMSEKRFNRLVYKLNHNVLYLCFSQRVNPELLHPHHTIHNILTLLKTDGLGRCRPFSIDSDMVQSIEVKGSVRQDDSDTDTEGNIAGDDMDGPTDLEWERVPISIPEVEASGISSSDGNYYPYSTVAGGTSRLVDPRDSQATSTVMGGLMTSAAASVTSLWRAATWKS